MYTSVPCRSLLLCFLLGLRHQIFGTRNRGKWREMLREETHDHMETNGTVREMSHGTNGNENNPEHQRPTHLVRSYTFSKINLNSETRPTQSQYLILRINNDTTKQIPEHHRLKRALNMFRNSMRKML